MGNHLIATPGQVFEGKFGIDAAMEAHHPIFWEQFGYTDVPAGVQLNDYNWGYIWKKTKAKRRLPTFALNLLVQAKRPEILKGNNCAIYHLVIKWHYWRYKITEHQQEILEKIA